MSRCRRRARPAYPVVLLFVLALVPLGGAAVPITGAGVDQALSAELGGGLSGGSNCLGAPSCSDSKTNLGPVPLAIPLWSGISADISSNAGSNSVGAGASARASLSEPDELLLDLYPDVVLVGAIRAGAWLRDSKSTSFHTWASASVSSDDFLQFAVPSLLAGESFLMDVGLTSFSASLTTLFSGGLTVEDVTSGSLLASFGASSPGYTTLDLSDLSGHDIRVSLTAEIAMAGAEGFGGGADALGARSFSSALSGGFQLSHVAIPEPASALLIAVGLSSIALSRRRR